MAKPSDAEYTKLKWLLEKLEASEQYCEPYFDRAQRHYKLYRFGSAVEDDDWPYVNRTRSRDILAFVEDSTAIMIQTLFATSPFFSVIGRETEIDRMKQEGIDPIKLADQISMALAHQVEHEDTEFFEEMVDYFKGGMILGNSYMGVYPKFNSEGRYHLPLLKTHDYWDVMPIAGARRVTRSKGVFIREFMNLDDLKALGKKGVFKQVYRLKSSEGNDADKDWHKRLLQDIGMTAYEVDDKNIEVIHYFSGGHIITFGNRKVILRDSTGDETTPYPYNMPAVQYKYMTVPLEFFAMGIPEVLECLQEDKNLIRSARRDNIDLVIQQILKVRAGADINLDLLQHYPGAMWPLENLNDIEAHETKDVTQSSYQEEAMREHDMENALSLFGYARGQTPQHSEQPTTVMKLQQASLNRLDLAVKMAEFTTLQNIAARIILLTRRYMEQGDYEAIVGGQDAGFYKLSEEEIKRFFMFKPVGSSVTNIKELRQKQIETAMQMTLNIPPEAMASNVVPFRVDLHEMLKTAYDAVDIKNTDRILRKLSPEEIQQMQEAQKEPPFEQKIELAKLELENSKLELEGLVKKFEERRLDDKAKVDNAKTHTESIKNLAQAEALEEGTQIHAYEAKVKKIQAEKKPTTGGAK